ncbi:hypothetical protein NBRC10512_001189 [Rhodotorula toruloides]|uniref:RHTO0S06e03994g1_1 n=2 Tax=Rhodotorula toruloides TaxID=5286 RepID=A0A061AWS5_RHOTO|nr:arrestin/PY protein 1 [Rhodotorula toruloides NP11]EMS24165.1 arrestin/PY protein 1 [Rhodotorula toruloides NP11]CDR41665.1 RHTO0S06e03994g1_1 [Rhodotorula toruloides]
MPHAGSEPLEIHLESNDLVLRGFTGDEFEPAVLNGELILNLVHPTDLKEVSLVFTGVAKVAWRDSSTHHHDHPLFFHDFNFLNPSSHTSREDAKKEQHHVHTLKAGRHVFPFSLTVPGSLPASLRTYSGTGIIEYKLKALAQRPGFTAADWKARKIVRLSRSFPADAVEFNQTLEIENTWPGKVMYSFTIPHKAYAAGDTIPVAVKFSPLAKGVRIVSLITTIREHTTVYSKSSSHSEARDATVVKYNFLDAPSARSSGANTPAPRIESSASLSSLGAQPSGVSTPTTPGFNSPIHGSRTPVRERGDETGYPFSVGRASRPRARFQLGPEDEDEEEELHQPHPAHEEHEEVDDGQDTEIDVVVDVQIPIWTAPSHAVHPVFVNHKIKWSAFIKNPDGHVSELRCALPIHILASCLQDEARLASAGSRNLLFGESGVLAHSDVPQVDLPSYQDHVMDRIANAETASYFTASSGFAPTPWSTRTTPTGTPGISPPASRPPSRPASPDRRSSHHSSFGGFGGFSALSALSHRDTSARSSTPASPQPTSPPPEQQEHPEDHRNWVDSELLSTLNVNDHTSPPTSAPTSRPGSRPGSRPPSRPSSRPGSRASSPDRASSMAMPIASAPTTPGDHEERPPLSRSHTSGSFFNLHFPKPLRPLTSFSRNNSASNLRDMLHMSSSGSDSRRGSTAPQQQQEDPAGTPSPSALSNALAAHVARTGSTGPAPRPSLAMDTAPQAIHTHPLMSNSPSHTPPHNPATANLSNGASPISASPAQPSPISPGHNSNFHLHYLPTPPPLLSPSPMSSTPSRTGVSSPALSSSVSSSGRPAGEHAGPSDVDFLSQVPPYDIAARGFLGGGVVPLSFNPPLYDDVCSPGGTRPGSRAGNRADKPHEQATLGEGPHPATQEGALAHDFAVGGSS